MKPHWNEDEFADQVVDPRTQSHADECADCHDELEKFSTALLGFRDAVHSAAERPPFFWAAQRTAIHAHVADRPKPHGTGWALASTAALVALALIMLLPGNTPQPSGQSNTSANVQVDEDELLMQRIGDSLLSNVADPLQPTNLIASDLNNAVQQAQNGSAQ